MQRLFTVLYCACILLQIVYGTITGRKGTSTENEEKILMSGVHPSVEDEYFCIAKKLKPNDQYITSFEALANSTSVHHLLLFGCETPHSDQPGSWKCGRICRNAGPSILYAWAKNAPPVNMPPNVGFHVGGKTSVSYIVMQIHYKNPIEKSRPGDRSGVKLTITTKPQNFIAGIYIFMRYYFTIPAHSTGVHSDISCRYEGKTKLYPFAFRVHAHSLGRVISAYQYNDTGWHKLGKGNPQWPQAFYPINENLVIKQGDRLAARCTFDASNRDTDTHIGPTHRDEMCNFYLMYYTPANKGESYFHCSDDSIPRLSDKLPDESDSPLPSNPLLENWASGILSSGRPASHLNAENYDIFYDYYDTDKPKFDYYYDIPNLYKSYSPYRKQFYQNVQRQPPAIKQPYMQRPHHDNMVDHGSVEASRNRVTEKVIHETEKPKKFTVLPKYVASWPKAKVKLGQVSGVGIDSKGNVHVFHRGERVWDGNAFDNNYVLLNKTPIKDACVVVFDSDGNILRTWGSNMFYMPHGIHIDKDDNVWVTDVGSHQVFKFPPNSATPSLILGTKLIPGGGSKHFCKPTDVVTLSSGEFFVADGYCNSRIIKYKANGEIIIQWGEFLTDRKQVDDEGYPAPNKFLVPHSLSVNEKKNIVYVADRENGRLIAFNYQGNFIFQSHPKEFGGNLFSVAYDKKSDLIYAVNGPDAYRKLIVEGFILDSATGKLLRTWSSPRRFSQPHDIAISKDGACLYVCDIGLNILHKFNLDDKDVVPHSISLQKSNQNHKYDEKKIALTRSRSQPQVTRRIRTQNRLHEPHDILEGKIIGTQMEGYLKKNFDKILSVMNTAEESDEFKIVFNEILSLLEGTSLTTLATLREKDIINKFNSLTFREKLKMLTTINETDENTVLPGIDVLVVTTLLANQSTKVVYSTTPLVLEGSQSEVKDEDMKASIIIGSLLLVPVLVIVIVVVILRLKRSGKISYIDATASFGKINKNRRNFNIGQIFNRHKGFDRLSQEDGELDHLNSDSEVEDYSTTEQKA